MPLSGCHQVIVRQSLGSHQAVSHQAVVRQFSGSCQAVVRQLSGSCQADVRQSSGSRQATKFSDSLTLFQPCVCVGAIYFSLILVLHTLVQNLTKLYLELF